MITTNKTIQARKEIIKKKIIEKKYPYSEITNKIIACAIEVHRELGPGFIENIHEKSMIYELKQRSLYVEQQKIIPVIYNR